MDGGWKRIISLTKTEEEEEGEEAADTASGLRDSWMHLLVCQQSVLLLFVFLPRLRLRVRVCVRVGEKKLSRAFRAERKNEIGKRDSLGCGIKDK